MGTRELMSPPWTLLFGSREAPPWTRRNSTVSSVKRAELPMTSPDRHMSKEDFAAHYARVEVA